LNLDATAEHTVTPLSTNIDHDPGPPPTSKSTNNRRQNSPPEPHPRNRRTRRPDRPRLTLNEGQGVQVTTIIGFGITRLLNFDLIARFKQINVMKLYLPGKTDKFSYPLLGPTLTRPIKPEIIENNYDLMIKYATAIRQGTASTEALLRRFQGETTHPAYSAMLEVGCAQRTIFLARWLRDRDLQRETESGLNVVENYNGVNDYIRFGKRGELASNRREEQELGMLCLQILQSCLAYINTLMIQDTLAEPEWANALTDVDRRGLTPLFHTNMTPYGTVQLRPDHRLDLSASADPEQRPSEDQ
ncbi:MAG: Tn3 family transposase, partial [Pseudonocardiaceae bacterium]